MKIFLWGMMGSGKTSVGRHVAATLRLPWYDLDARIEERTGKLIPALFEELGQQGFRELERRELEAVLAEPACVLSCGGGTPCFFDNAALMNAAGRTVYLHTTVDELARRLENETQHRPLLQDATPQSLRNQLAHLLLKRRAAYEQAQLSLDTDELPTSAVAALVCEYSLSDR
ncbi:MAG: shikimate kinase [Bacteroidetes bacterium]|nr:shikimate kinase [Bacteroidota bacterium]